MLGGWSGCAEVRVPSALRIPIMGILFILSKTAAESVHSGSGESLVVELVHLCDEGGSLRIFLIGSLDGESLEEFPLLATEFLRRLDDHPHVLVASTESLSVCNSLSLEAEYLPA